MAKLQERGVGAVPAVRKTKGDLRLETRPAPDVLVSSAGVNTGALLHLGKKKGKGGVGGISWKRAKRKERAFFLKTHQAHAPPFPAPPPPRMRAKPKSGHSGGIVRFCKRTNPGAVLVKREHFCAFFQKKRTKAGDPRFFTEIHYGRL